MRKLLGWLLVLIIAVVAWQQRTPPSTTDTAPPASVPVGAPADASTVTTKTSHRPEAPPGLPAEAADTLARIAAGGPFRHDQDGVVFGNYEGLLPKRPRGYYHEYTVETPGSRTRGARRIITGGQPPQAYYYTDDHYRSFRRFEVPR